MLSLDDKATLQVRGATVHETRSDDRMLFQLRRQSFEEGAALQWVDRRRAGLDGGVYSASDRLSMGSWLPAFRPRMTLGALQRQEATRIAYPVSVLKLPTATLM